MTNEELLKRNKTLELVCNQLAPALDLANEYMKKQNDNLVRTTQELVIMQERIDKLRDTLNKIQGPKLRDHKEELDCVMNIAMIALGEDNNYMMEK